MVPGGVTSLTGCKDVGRVFGDVHAQGRVIVVEREPGEDLRVEEPEVVVRQPQFTSLGTAEVTDVLARGDIAGRARQQELLSRRERFVDQTDPLEALAL